MTLKQYLSISWVRQTLRYSLYAPRRPKVLGAFVVGSEAKETARSNSDLDIAVIIPPVMGKTALRYTEEYHSHFPNDETKPCWNGRRVDFQFFYPNALELETYQKIPLGA